MRLRLEAFAAHLSRRRSVRTFSAEPVPRDLIETALRVAGTAPNGANQQPWHFAVVSNPHLKRQIRDAAETEERAFYNGRAPQAWLEALMPLGTDAEKPFLETAPYLIVIFAQTHGTSTDGASIKHYYVQESVGIATGFLIAALHHAGLATLTHTPNPMKFLGTLCGRPDHEKPVMIALPSDQETSVPVTEEPPTSS
ncbi:MAG: nitroreductase family protein [Pleurocapsa sp. SU_196_0]|nr:nitroreductase family protein [Pleurocapsa sp. SU_196_0]